MTASLQISRRGIHPRLMPSEWVAPGLLVDRYPLHFGERLQIRLLAAGTGPVPGVTPRAKWGYRFVCGGSLMCTMPTDTRSANARPLMMSVVMMASERPLSV
jgi:hypothetical protein